MLQCGAVCCRVLQFVKVCCSGASFFTLRRTQDNAIAYVYVGYNCSVDNCFEQNDCVHVYVCTHFLM